MTAARRTLVTGATGGIGRAIALELSRRGHEVAGVARDVHRLAAIAEEASRFRPVPLDLDADGACTLAVERSKDALGGLDGLVVAHGVAEHGPLEALDEVRLDRHLRVNLRAPLLLLRAFARLASPPATVVLVTSTLGLRPALGTTAYAASKAGLEAAAKALALELWPRGIRVATIAPGLTDTAMLHPIRLGPGEVAPTAGALEARREAQRAELAALSPIGRLARPEEIAAGVAFLFENELALGTTLVLDGGLTAK
jgi:NAD(P)-dependent dehydrogenase (short-subunit alcohol dehydrogenase family)